MKKMSNGISAAGAKEIAQNIKHLQGLKEFELDQQYNGISAAGPKEIAQNFKHLKAFTEFTLNLGCLKICGFLKGQ